MNDVLLLHWLQQFIIGIRVFWNLMDISKSGKYDWIVSGLLFITLEWDKMPRVKQLMLYDGLSKCGSRRALKGLVEFSRNIKI